MDAISPWHEPIIRRIGRGTGVPDVAYDPLETFVDQLPRGEISDVIKCFAPLPRGARAAA
jgi:hypothetical protein